MTFKKRTPRTRHILVGTVSLWMAARSISSNYSTLSLKQIPSSSNTDRGGPGNDQVLVRSELSSQCADGIDNDWDGKVDFPDDPGCQSASDPYEKENISNDGWTQFSPSVDTRIIYVSSSSGNDAFDGLSETAPKRTVAAGLALMRNGFPDWVLLKSGDVWETSPLWIGVSGRSPTEPARIGAYGTGSRPLLRTGSEGGMTLNQKQYVAITDLELVAHTYDGINGGGTGIFFGQSSHLLFENLYIHDYFGGLSGQNDDVTPITDIALRRNVIANQYKIGSAGHAMGSFLSGIHRLLLDQNVYFHNGRREDISGAVATIFRRAIYIQYNCKNIILVGNIAARSASNEQARSGGYVVDNLFMDNSVGLSFGNPTASPEGPQVVAHNVVIGSRDIDVNNPTGAGFEIAAVNNTLVYRNIIKDRFVPATWNLSGLIIGTADNVTVSENIVYDWYIEGANGPSALTLAGNPTRLKVLNNAFQMPRGGNTVSAYSLSGIVQQNGIFSGNRYFSAQTNAFDLGAGTQSFSTWVAQSNETGGSFERVTYQDPGRSVATYMAGLGYPPSTQNLNGFMFEATRQSKSLWRKAFTAEAFNAYIRDGFKAAP